ncbi:hypothetical protein VTJ49DRAFT_5190 [Mycothermus thermophilus]|uniref:tripeptidyl-peptidase II n=1 Tax=Humicola insolens TaxID=85995 RepID=A0ABR3VKP3_HUMIN
MAWVLLVLLAAVASARVMDSLAAVPRDWFEIRTALPDEPIHLRIALQQQPNKVRMLDKAALEMATPGHANYGKHLTRDELSFFTAPSDVSVSAVTSWLRQNAIQPSLDHDWLTFTTTVSTANELLNARFAWYEHKEAPAHPALRTLSYSVPDHIAPHIDLVQPTTRFGNLAARRSTIFEVHRLESEEVVVPGKGRVMLSGEDDLCLDRITPKCLRGLYNMYYTPVAPEDNKVAFTSFLEQYARYHDLDRFTEKLFPEARGANFSVELINVGLNDQYSWDDSIEANLDAQYLLAMSHPIPMIEYRTSGRGPLVPTTLQPDPPGTNEPYLEFLLHLASLPDSDLPQTISTSYGEEEQSVPPSYALKVCDMFKELGARGVSVLFASGDSGPGAACILDKGNNTATFFEPTFPAGCPWVTAVGSTTNMASERAAYFSSGGFSMYHPQPAWQKDAVDAYLDKIGDTYAAYFNRTGRAFPDVAAQGSDFLVSDQGAWTSVSGTSASAPVVAGMVALLNAARKARGERPLGFLNPWSYNNAAAFKDITQGAGVGCRGRREFGRRGARWNATEGWDPVTGLGTPLFDKLLEAAVPGVRNE